MAHGVGDRRPARIVTYLDDHFDDFLACDPEVLRAAVVRMIARGTCQRDVRRKGDELALSQAESLARPYISEQMPYRELVELRTQLLLIEHQLFAAHFFQQIHAALVALLVIAHHYSCRGVDFGMRVSQHAWD